ncbi:Predicted GTPase [Paenibacillus polymyxa]|uniref:hypothetical protein n=1 Tax=Paenibacillus polymyxa TaxID=1406 RepID=UPI000D8FD1F5|nr:hypothetical protein [Paenibacillus polymyxa]SPY17279.1 Predicted GTPase [Paenibacillus polymyxa]
MTQENTPFAVLPSIQPIQPEDALQRLNTYPSICIIGPTGAGKTALTNAILNHMISSILKIGVGEKNQTTLISTNYITDSRIEREDRFALRLQMKPLDDKMITGILISALFELFCKSDYNAEETIENMEESWWTDVLEPEKANYHLGFIHDFVSLEELKFAIAPILENIEIINGKSFSELAREKKKESSLQSLKITEVRKHLFEETWEELKEEHTGRFYQWLQNIEIILWAKLKEILRFKEATPVDTLDRYGSVLNIEDADILTNIFDPKAPYSLIIKEAYIACRPNQELINDSNTGNGKPPFRLCLRDTVGVNQTANDRQTIRAGLEVGMAYHSDLLLVLLNLEDRDDTIRPICEMIEEASNKKNRKSQVPIKILFTKADKLIETKVSQLTPHLVVDTNDYEKLIPTAVKEVGKTVKTYSSVIENCDASWLSLRYRNPDPIQNALDRRNDFDPKEAFGYTPSAFEPAGIYGILRGLVDTIQNRMLPAGMNSPYYITVDKPNEPIVQIRIDKDKVKDLVQGLQYQLTQNSQIVNMYLLPMDIPKDGLKVSPWSFNAYWNYLQQGLGHRTNARSGKYLNFNINMKSLVARELGRSLQTLNVLYDRGAVDTLAINLKERPESFDSLLNALHTTDLEIQKAFSGWSPHLVEERNHYDRNTQILQFKLCQYFQDPDRQFQIIDRVAFALTFGNKEIKDRLIREYREEHSHDRTMRRLQNELKRIFEGDEFATLLVQELSEAMSNMVNKLFIAI